MTPTGIRYLLDTNVLVAYVRGGELGRRIEADYQLTALSGSADAPLVSIVTEAEILSFATRRGWGETKRAYLNQFLRRLVVVPVEHPDVVNAYVQIEVFSESAGRPLGSKNDLWIAATASVTGATLLTTDRDFDHLHPRFLLREWINPSTP